MKTVHRLGVGFSSLLALVAVVAGVPAALLGLGRNPLADGLPSWDEVIWILSRPDSGTFVLALFTVVGWACWLILMAALLLEMVARVRRVPAPQLPGPLHLPQIAARQVVGGVFLLFAVAPMTVTLAHAAPSPPAAAVAADTPQSAAPGVSRTTVIVQQGDTLAGIARTHLNDESRWPDLFEASKGTRQPERPAITDPDLIWVGETVTLPTVATPAAAAAMPEAGSAATPAPLDTVSPRANEPVPAAPAVAEPAVAQPAPASAAPAAPATGPAQESAQGGAAAAAAAQPHQPVQGQVRDDSELFPVRTVFGAGALMAAGVVTLIGARRQLQRRRRAFGADLWMPDDEDAVVEQQMRAAADQLGWEDVDQALRQLARDCAAQQLPAPTIRAARLTDAQLELYLTGPAQLPAPWRSINDDTVWFFDAETVEHLDPQALEGIPAPYPALVTLGQDAEDGHVMVDLEFCGSLGLSGDPSLIRESIAALALELATSRWADDLTVTLVGAYSEMEESLQTGRIRYLPSMEKLLDSLERRAHHDSQALTEAGVTLTQARAQGVVADAWTPEIVMAVCPITERQRHRLAALLEHTHGLAIAFVTTQGEPLTDWELRLDSADSAGLLPLGVTITPQRVTGEAYERLLSIVAATSEQQGPPRVTTPIDDSGDDKAVAETPTPLKRLIHPVSSAAAFVMSRDQVEQLLPTGTHPPALDQSPTPDDTQPPLDPDTLVEAELVEAAAPRTAADASTSTAASSETSIDPCPGDGPPDPAAEPSTDPDPLLRILGPVDLLHAHGSVDPQRMARLVEYLSLLLLHPAPTFTVIDEAIWPSRTNDDNSNTRSTNTSRLRRWLGKDSQGEEYLPAYGNYRLHPAVTSDWSQFQQLVAGNLEKVPSENLDQALELVRGRPFEGTPARCYAWAEPYRQRMTSLISDVAYELGRRRLMAGNWPGVEAAVVKGIQVDPALERLWRLRLLAAHQSGNQAMFSEAVARMEALSDALGVALDPETEQLLDMIKREGSFQDLLHTVA